MSTQSPQIVRTPAAWPWRVALYLLVIGHFAVIFGMFLAFFILPFLQPWYVALPLDVWIFNLTVTREECKLTRLENYIRQRVGLKRIGGFVGHYQIKPFRKKRKEAEQED